MRSDWLTFIASDVNAGRYLFLRGSSRLAVAPSISEEKLRDFWNTLGRHGPDSRLLARVHFLASQKLRVFIEEMLGEILRAITGSIRREREISRSGIRGKIDWGQTTSLRMSARGDSATFALTVPFRSQDLPENRLLKLFLTDIVRVVKQVEQVVGTGSLLAEFEALRITSEVALKNPALRNVKDVRRSDAQMRLRAQRNKNWRYSRLVELHDLFEDVLLLEKWEATYQLIKAGWLAPISDDDIFELYALILALDVLREDAGLGDPVEHRVIARGRGRVALFRHAGVEVAVYFDQSSIKFASRQGVYRQVIDNHAGLSGKSRRPDISIVINTEGGTSGFIVLEVKRSDDGGYQSDSVYKVFGYLWDLQDLWPPQQAVRAILMFPTAVEYRELASLVCVSGDDREALARAFRSAFEDLQ